VLLEIGKQPAPALRLKRRPEGAGWWRSRKIETAACERRPRRAEKGSTSRASGRHAAAGALGDGQDGPNGGHEQHTQEPEGRARSQRDGEASRALEQRGQCDCERAQQAKDKHSRSQSAAPLGVGAQQIDLCRARCQEQNREHPAGGCRPPCAGQQAGKSDAGQRGDRWRDHHQIIRMEKAGDAEEGGAGQEPDPPENELPPPEFVQRTTDAPTLIPSAQNRYRCCSGDGERQQPARLAAELLIDKPQRAGGALHEAGGPSARRA